MLTDEQKKLRRTGIGGSEIAAVVGLNPYAGPIDVWRAKVEGHELEETSAMRRGRFLEDGVAKWWAAEKGAALRDVGTVRHPKEEIVLCTPDRLAEVAKEEIDLSIKVPGPHTMEHWGADGSDEVPDAYLLQVQWELIPLGVLYGIRKAVVTAPVHGELRSYPVVADADIQGQLVEAAKRFWKYYVLPAKPPPPDASESYSEWLAAKYRNGSGPEVQPTPALFEAAEKLRAARKAEKAAKAEATAARNFILACVGDAAGVVGLLSCGLNAGKPAVDWPALCAAHGISQSEIEKFTRRTPHRAVRLTKGGSDE